MTTEEILFWYVIKMFTFIAGYYLKNNGMTFGAKKVNYSIINQSVKLIGNCAKSEFRSKIAPKSISHD